MEEEVKGLGRDEYWKRDGETLHGGGDEKRVEYLSSGFESRLEERV